MLKEQRGVKWKTRRRQKGERGLWYCYGTEIREQKMPILRFILALIVEATKLQALDV